MNMTNKTYDRLRIVALIIAPVSVFVVAVLTALHAPQLDTVTAILAAFDALIGSLVEIARKEYNAQNGDGVEG